MLVNRMSREEDGQFLLLALHAVQLGVARHFFDQFGWNVLAEAIRQLSFAARFSEVAPGHVEGKQGEDRRKDCRQQRPARNSIKSS